MKFWYEWYETLIAIRGNFILVFTLIFERGMVLQIGCLAFWLANGKVGDGCLYFTYCYNLYYKCYTPA